MRCGLELGGGFELDEGGVLDTEDDEVVVVDAVVGTTLLVVLSGTLEAVKTHGFGSHGPGLGVPPTPIHVAGLEISRHALTKQHTDSPSVVAGVLVVNEVVLRHPTGTVVVHFEQVVVRPPPSFRKIVPLPKITGNENEMFTVWPTSISNFV